MADDAQFFERKATKVGGVKIYKKERIETEERIPNKRISSTLILSITLSQ